ncbi:hypothetical protein HHK36_010389 [Tetracentron sinense]|uniref:O-methyltransferase C-terminal domain-containing protein n=1 Tax=Tetracentron sinense TaxID=13715 RepID=A0A835DMB9_TETSI|nr:hypothetical protein HHK36_010389 [Tetracentron sinense]
MLVKAFPWIRGINFDLPHVVSAAPSCDGVEHQGGDMFNFVPNTDAAFLKCVLHNWGDEECIDLLRKCREAIPEDKGKVIIVEAVIEEEEEHKLKDIRLMLDMVMMAHTNKGKERTAKEWSFVLSQSGFSSTTSHAITDELAMCGVSGCITPHVLAMSGLKRVRPIRLNTGT